MFVSQLPLAISLQKQKTFSSYEAGNNLFVVESLQSLCAGRGERYIYLWAEPGRGRSHLLQACCHQAQKTGKTAQYLPLAEIIEQQPHLLDGLEVFDLVCLDDIHLIAGNRLWEEAVFHLFNRLQVANSRVIISAIASPAQSKINLLDLGSRLASGLTLHLKDLDDDHKITVLQIHARQRGLELPAEVGQFLIKRYSRALPALLELLEKLDNASLAAQRRLTIPFVKTVLSLEAVP